MARRSTPPPNALALAGWLLDPHLIVLAEIVAAVILGLAIAFVVPAHDEKLRTRPDTVIKTWSAGSSNPGSTGVSNRTVKDGSNAITKDTTNPVGPYVDTGGGVGAVRTSLGTGTGAGTAMGTGAGNGTAAGTGAGANTTAGTGAGPSVAPGRVAGGAPGVGVTTNEGGNPGPAAGGGNPSTVNNGGAPNGMPYEPNSGRRDPPLDWRTVDYGGDTPIWLGVGATGAHQVMIQHYDGRWGRISDGSNGETSLFLAIGLLAFSLIFWLQSQDVQKWLFERRLSAIQPGTSMLLVSLGILSTLLLWFFDWSLTNGLAYPTYDITLMVVVLILSPEILAKPLLYCSLLPAMVAFYQFTAGALAPRPRRTAAPKPPGIVAFGALFSAINLAGSLLTLYAGTGHKWPPHLTG